jgi:hypothetical protein
MVAPGHQDEPVVPHRPVRIVQSTKRPVQVGRGAGTPGGTIESIAAGMIRVRRDGKALARAAPVVAERVGQAGYSVEG